MSSGPAHGTQGDMLVVRIELHSANTGRVTEIGKMLIGNDESAVVPGYGNYNVVLCRVGSHATSNKRRRLGRVEGYPRETANIWDLISRAIASVLPR